MEKRVLGYLAKYQETYEVTLYAFTMQGNHFHTLSRFEHRNRSKFFRDLNARTAEAVRYEVPQYPGGPLFERRYSEQAIPLDVDIEDRFFYCALQPVHAGLVERISEYPGYNSFSDAICGIEREFKVVDWAAYNAQKRFSPRISIADFTRTYKLRYQRLPGYEDLSQKAYRDLMLKKLEQRRVEIVNEWKKKGHRFLSPGDVRAVRPGSLPKRTKKSARYDKRPLVLTRCVEAKRQFLEWYFSIYHHYKEVVGQYLSGDTTVTFPLGTYKPPGPLVCEA